MRARRLRRRSAARRDFEPRRDSDAEAPAPGGRQAAAPLPRVVTHGRRRPVRAVAVAVAHDATLDALEGRSRRRAWSAPSRAVAAVPGQ